MVSSCSARVAILWSDHDRRRFYSVDHLPMAVTTSAKSLFARLVLAALLLLGRLHTQGIDPKQPED